MCKWHLYYILTCFVQNKNLGIYIYTSFQCEMRVYSRFCNTNHCSDFSTFLFISCVAVLLVCIKLKYLQNCVLCFYLVFFTWRFPTTFLLYSVHLGCELFRSFFFSFQDFVCKEWVYWLIQVLVVGSLHVSWWPIIVNCVFYYILRE